MNWVILLVIGILFMILVFVIFYFIRKKEKKIDLFDYSIFRFFKNFISPVKSEFITNKESLEKINKDFKEKKDLKNKDEGVIGFREKIKKSNKKKDNKEEPNLEKEKIKKEKTDKNLVEKEIDKIKKEELKKDSKKGYIFFESVEEAINFVEDPEIKNIISMLIENNYGFLKKILLEKRFESFKDFIDFLKQEIVNFLYSEYENIKKEISFLRKKGKDVNEIDYKAMMIPSKIKIFSSSFKEKDFKLILDRISEIKKEIKEFEKGLE